MFDCVWAVAGLFLVVFTLFRLFVFVVDCFQLFYGSLLVVVDRLLIVSGSFWAVFGCFPMLLVVFVSF